MSAKKWMTEEETKDMFEMFDNNFSTKEIMNLTGRSLNTVKIRRKEWRKMKENNGVKVESAPQEVIEKKPEENASDYARQYLSGDFKNSRSVFEIKRSVSIQSKKTGILYEMETDKPVKSVTMTLQDGSSVSIELGVFAKFVDESVDVLLELNKTA